ARTRRHGDGHRATKTVPCARRRCAGRRWGWERIGFGPWAAEFTEKDPVVLAWRLRRGGICPYTARLAGLQPGIGRLAQRESAALTQQRSLVRSQHRPPDSCNATAPTRALACPGMPRSF